MSFSPKCQQLCLVISAGHGTSLTLSLALDKKILLAPASPPISAALLQLQVFLLLFHPPGRLPSRSPPPTPLTSPRAAAAPENSGPRPGLQPHLSPEHCAGTQPGGHHLWKAPRLHTASSPSGSALLPQCLPFTKAFCVHPVVWSRKRGCSLPWHHAGGHILDSSRTHSSSSSASTWLKSHCVFPPGPALPRNWSLTCSLMALLTVPTQHHIHPSGKASLQWAPVANHPGAPLPSGCALHGLVPAHCPHHSSPCTPLAIPN